MIRKIRHGQVEGGDGDGRKKSGTIRRVDVLAETLAKSKTIQQLECEIMEFDSMSELHKQMIRKLLSDLSPADINNLRYRMFAPHYDEHMKGHERAIRFLVRQLKAMEEALGGRVLLNDRILEASCGTGTVIEIICQEFGSQRAGKFNIIANDISDEMKAIAKEKLGKYPAKVTFTSQDLKRLPFQNSSFRTLIISQTMHLITDDAVLAQERAHNYMHISGKRHLGEKMQFFRRAFDLLDPDGTLLVIDEWPALLTDRGGPLGAGFAYLFNDGLRPIDEKALRYSIMGRIPGARLVADFNVPIDADHSMHLLVYRKEIRLSNERAQVPVDRFMECRENAARTILNVFRTVDPQFIESNQPESGEKPWIEYIPLSGKRVLFVDETNLDKIGQGYDCIIFDQSLHEIEREMRHEVVSKAVRSVAMGGSLIMIAEWEPPEGSTNPVKRGTFNHIMDEMSRNLIFEGEVRLPIAEGYLAGMYGLHYRRVF